MERVLDTLKEWRAVIDRYQVDGETAVATSAVRDAANRDAFLARIKQTTGFDVEVISGEEEARRTLLGLRSDLPPDIHDILGVDIGGGSTEFILDRCDGPPLVRSIDVGVVRLTERCLFHDPPTDEELAEASQLVREHMERVRPLVGTLETATVVGTAGTITTVAAMVQRLAAYAPARIHHYTLTLDDLVDRA
jgi:exopolyphosphatase/guanosine-5'-triphosphate,3'-diphosphate pyrophosphatase